jgi:hypothetical protein
MLGAVALASVPAVAQQVEIRAPAPEDARPEIIAPPLQLETTRPYQADDYPAGMRVPYDPAFIEPFAWTWETVSSSGAFGLSGWTAPNPPVGSAAAAARDLGGYFAIGLSFTWGGPPPRPARSIPR